MRKYPSLILPTLAILAIFATASIAQVFTRALQLSQDTTGAFSVDSNNGIYFPGHILTTSGVGNPAPTVTAAVGSPTVSGTDFAGTVTMGTSATSANLTFGRAFVTTPTCLASWQGNATTTTPISYVPGTTGIQFGQGSTSSNKVAYLCTAPS